MTRIFQPSKRVIDSSLRHYANHLKSLTLEDKRSRFGFDATESTIDKLILNILYNPRDHIIFSITELFSDDTPIGWGHLARMDESKWEWALSVRSEKQRMGVGDSLTKEMISFCKSENIKKVIMFCVESNKKVQSLAKKNGLETIDRNHGEHTAVLQIPEPGVIDIFNSFAKEGQEIAKEVAKINQRIQQIFNKSGNI
jgi:GNAT superfamily N-acetyltransferase